MAAEQAKPGRGFLRRALFRLLALITVYAVAEVLALVAYTIDSPDRFSFWRNQAERIRLVEASGTQRFGATRYARNQTVHPYFGYTNDPDVNPSVNDFGFKGPLPAVPGLTSRSDGVVTVALLGGSVANNVGDELAAALSESLPRLERFAGRRVELHNLAIAAMKQPQQMLIHTYFEALGADIDVVILLDGFNEIMMTGEMAKSGLNPLLPHNWDIRAASMMDVGSSAEIGGLVHAEQRRADLARRFSHPWLVHSVSANTLWYFLDRRRMKDISDRRVRVQKMLSRSSREHARWMHKGPEWPLEGPRPTVEFYVGLWARCSRSMAETARRGGAEFFHFLQPNQYVPGSKELTDVEERVAIETAPRYRPAVELGYPLLREAGAALQAGGVRYHDLTMIFRDVEETIYRDTCCHLNARGDRIMAGIIAKEIAEALD